MTQTLPTRGNASRLRLPWSDEPMTLLMALVDDEGGLIVAADGEESSLDGESWGAEPREKFFRLPGRRVMWGWAGSSDVGVPFGDWLRGEAPLQSWEALRSAAGPKMRELCVGEDHAGSGNAAIVAGHLEDGLGILRVDFSGFADVRRNGRVTEGINKWAALWGWEYAVSLQGNTPETLYRWLNHLVIRAGGIGPPVGVWRSGGPNEDFVKLDFES